MINFPAAPTNGQTFTSGGVTWTYDGTKWTTGGGTSGVYLPLDGSAPMTGPLNGTNATFSGNINAAGETLTGPLTGVSSTYTPGPVRVVNNAPGPGITAGFSASAAPGNDVHINGQKNNLNRWIVALGDNAAEGGANAGSNFGLQSCDDAGAPLGLVPLLAINRPNGFVNLIGYGAAPSSNTNAFAIGSMGLALNKNGGAFVSSLIGTANGLLRWNMVLGNGTAESGANAGSDFTLNAYSDAGANLGTAFTIARATQIVTFTKAIVNPSDRALKSNIEPVTGALAKVNAMEGVYFTMDGDAKRQVGLVAQDVQPVLPEVVYENTNEAGEPVLGIAYSQIVAVLINAVKELSVRVQALEAA